MAEARDFEAELAAIKAWDVSNDPLGTKWLAQQAAIKDLALAKEQADRLARIDAISREVAEEKQAKIATEAEALGVPVQVYALFKGLEERVQTIEVRLGLKVSPSRGPLAMDDWGRSLSDNRLIDRAVMTTNVGAMMAEGKLNGPPQDGRNWNNGGR